MGPSKSNIWKIIPSIFVFLILIYSSFFNTKLNKQRIYDQAAAFCMESASSKGELLATIISTNIKTIQTTAYLYGTSLSSSDPDLELLRNLEENTNFDYIRFMDVEGIDHTSSGVTAYCYDRDYFKKGISGENGVTVVFESRINGETLIGFFSPVYYQEKIIGILMGFLNQGTTNQLLIDKVYGYPVTQWIIDSEGSIIGSTSSDEITSFEQLVDINVVEKNRVEVKKAFEEDKEYHGFMNTAEGMTAFSIVPIPDTDFFLCVEFPSVAISKLINSANSDGFMVNGIIVATFVFFLTITITGLLHSRYLVKSESQKMSKHYQDVISSLSDDYDSIYYINLEKNEFNAYRVSDDVKPMLDQLNSVNMKYGQMIDFMVENSIAVEDRERMRNFFSIDHLKSVLNNEHIAIESDFRNDIEGNSQYIRVKFVKIGKEAATNEVVMGFSDVDEEKKKELQQQELMLEAYHQANQANAAKTTFLSSMSHEMRTPLNGIIGMTTIAKNNLENMVKVDDCLDKIQLAGNQLLNVVNEVLDMNKIESGKSTLELIQFNIVESMMELINSVNSEVISHKHEIILDTLKLSHQNVIGDETKIQQIVINFLSNAIKYTHDNGRIILSVAEEEGAIFKFSVEDNGMGMSEETIGVIFEPFERGEDTRINKIQGSGLGMSISHSLAQVMNGDISVTSQLGEGSKFTLAVKLEIVDEEKSIHEDKEDSLELEDLKFEGKRILVVEDNELNREVICEILELTNVEIETAVDGAIAFEKVKEMGDDYYSLIFMDIQMPNMNGYEATKAIRNLESDYAQRLPIIAMTANAFTDDVIASKQSGMNGHLAKPINIDLLVRVLNKYLS